MFVTPAGMILGADGSMADWRVWNQLPVLIGILVSGVFLLDYRSITHKEKMNQKRMELPKTKAAIPITQ